MAGHVTGSTLTSGAAQLVRILREEGGATRADLADRTGWSRSTLAQHLDGLLRSAIVIEVGEAISTGGRPATVLALNGSVGPILAACLGDTYTRVAVVDLSGQVLAHQTGEHPFGNEPLATLEWLVQRWRAQLAELGCNATEVRGIGVGLPGAVDASRGRLIDPPTMPGWHHFPVADWLHERFGCLVLVDNDANVMALGEHDAVRREADLIFIKADTTISAGVIADGVLHRGTHGLAGEIGHLHAHGQDDAPCVCGNAGCLEAVVGGRALAARLAAAGLPTADARQVVQHVRAGDPRAILALRDAGRILGHGIAALLNVFNPDVLVVGGVLAEDRDHLLTGVREVVYARSPPLATAALRIIRGVAGDDAGVLGAARLVAERVLATAGHGEATEPGAGRSATMGPQRVRCG